MDDNKETDIQELYEIFFRKQGLEKSKKYVNYLMSKICNFGIDYENPHRLHLMQQVKHMQVPYKNVFNKEII